MSLRPIVTIGAPILHARAREVTRDELPTADLRQLTADLIETMIDAKGIGIAAPQVGVGLRVAIINAKDSPIVIINPQLQAHGRATNIEEEGCLSIPGVYGMVKRWNRVTVAFTALDGREQTIDAHGLLARVFQHEIDHLDGILFTDRCERITQGRLP